ncbi:hypothetical protein OE88DRAFT_1811243 [Heliocybe sulcata]|uniref:Ubiquitin 3 binding protein But2 C-terminal domain-containing protein n=1 Tax=Heliocybe sulcata TaxID=5364 RepID=A0A5C3MRD6_9AGAM|nr:hypothetical protein OE88DRAFT_1811243 [Heliocybe sulcata]
MFARSAVLSFLAGFVSLYLAMPAFSMDTLMSRDLPAGLPRECYCNYTGCQYGPSQQPFNVTYRGILGPDGGERGLSASPGDMVQFKWEPHICYPDTTFAVAIKTVDDPDCTSFNAYSPGKCLVGPVLTNLGTYNQSGNGSLVFNGVGLTYGELYQATLLKYNTTTGAASVVVNLDFSWEIPYPY